MTYSLVPLSEASSVAQPWRTFDQNGCHSFFLTWDWISTLLEHLPPQIRPEIFRLDDSGRARGLTLITHRKMRYRQMVPIRQLVLNATGDRAFDCLAVEHNGSAFNEGRVVDGFWRSLFDHFDKTRADELFIPGMSGPIEGVPPNLLTIARTRPAFQTSLAQVRDAGGLQGKLSTNSRQQLARSIRALANMGPLRLERARNVPTALAYFDALQNLHIKSWTNRGKQHAFSRPFFEIFHRTLIEKGTQDGTTDLLRIRAGETDLGYLYNFRRNGTITNYQSGFDAGLNEMRPGYVCHALAIEQYASEGANLYDFLAGFNRLKQSFATEKYEMTWYRFRKPTLLFRAENVARKIAAIARSKPAET